MNIFKLFGLICLATMIILSCTKEEEGRGYIIPPTVTTVGYELNPVIAGDVELKGKVTDRGSGYDNMPYNALTGPFVGFSFTGLYDGGPEYELSSKNIHSVDDYFYWAIPNLSDGKSYSFRALVKYRDSSDEEWTYRYTNSITFVYTDDT